MEMTDYHIVVCGGGYVLSAEGPKRMWLSGGTHRYVSAWLGGDSFRYEVDCDGETLYIIVDYTLCSGVHIDLVITIPGVNCDVDESIKKLHITNPISLKHLCSILKAIRSPGSKVDE